MCLKQETVPKLRIESDIIMVACNELLKNGKKKIRYEFKIQQITKTTYTHNALHTDWIKLIT